ncbi:MAG: glycerol-3-phosphate 1-O-acyltransferase PlsY, partial [Planctomycetota bacterium]
MNFLFLIIGAYLLGSVPFGLVISRAHGKDIRKIGSGNIGATNLSRALGKKWAYLCFSLDVLKGLIPMLVTRAWIGHFNEAVLLLLWLVVGIAAVLGHIFPVYIGFKGGKGVATSFGVALGLWPYYTICSIAGFVVWLVFVLIWRYISLASIAGAVVFPLVLIGLVLTNSKWSFTELWPLLIAAVLIPVMVIIRHKENIKRILSGT